VPREPGPVALDDIEHRTCAQKIPITRSTSLNLDSVHCTVSHRCEETHIGNGLRLNDTS
jgi:hypothetical protein